MITLAAMLLSVGSLTAGPPQSAIEPTTVTPAPVPVEIAVEAPGALESRPLLVVLVAPEHDASESAPAAPAPTTSIEPSVVAFHDPRFLPSYDWATWDALARCESNNRWSIAGRRYFGGLQILPSTWRSYGGLEFARMPHLATREQQIVVARKIQRGGGWRQWGACARKLRLR